MKYPKINTLFNRDEKKKIILSQIVYDEFKLLKDLRWECTEKIDGTNIRIELDFNLPEFPDAFSMIFKGRTENSIIPEHLLKKLNEIFDLDILYKMFYRENKEIQNTITIFGEGYGFKIQEGHNYLKNDVGLILFDININGYWLQRDALEDIADQLHIPIVPLIGHMTIDEAIEYVKNGFKSKISINKDYDAEGLILKAPLGLLSRSGNRLITKLKTIDFKHLEK